MGKDFLIKNVMNYLDMDILNLFPPLLGFTGALLVFFYGIPRKIDYGDFQNFVVKVSERDEKQKNCEKKEIKKYKFFGNTGIILISIAFILEFSLKLLFIYIR